MTSDDHSGGTFSHQYTWDAEGRQLAATTQGAGTANYTYDGDGNRLKKVSGGVTTLYWYDAGGNILSESDGAGTLQKDYMYFNGRRIAMLYSSSAKFYFGDQIGSARQLTSSIGTAWDERVDSLLIVK